MSDWPWPTWGTEWPQIPSQRHQGHRYTNNHGPVPLFTTSVMQESERLAEMTMDGSSTDITSPSIHLSLAGYSRGPLSINGSCSSIQQSYSDVLSSNDRMAMMAAQDWAAMAAAPVPNGVSAPPGFSLIRNPNPQLQPDLLHGPLGLSPGSASASAWVQHRQYTPVNSVPIPVATPPPFSRQEPIHFGLFPGPIVGEGKRIVNGLAYICRNLAGTYDLRREDFQTQDFYYMILYLQPNEAIWRLMYEKQGVKEYFRECALDLVFGFPWEEWRRRRVFGNEWFA